MRYSIAIICFLVFHSSVVSQQRPQFTEYMLNKYAENPAYGGLERSLSIFTSFRDQYSNFPGNPRTFYLGADMPFYLWNGAIGFTFLNHRAGVFNNSNIKFSYNYVMSTPYGFLSFGGRAGIDFTTIDGNGLITPDGIYEGIFDHNDPTLDTDVFSGIGPSWELGAYFKGKSIEGGIMISELPSHKYALGDGKYTKSFSGSIFAMYTYLWSDNIKFSPSVLVKADAAVVQADIGFMTAINDNLLAGLNIRGYSGKSLDALSIILGTNMGKKYKVFYSYDFGLSQLRTAHQGTHEIMVTYNLQKLIGLGLPPKIIYNPRDL
jgi:type IX secretion system PorP/SprF family membrane protein